MQALFSLLTIEHRLVAGNSYKASLTFFAGLWERVACLLYARMLDSHIYHRAGIDRWRRAIFEPDIENYAAIRLVELAHGISREEWQNSLRIRINLPSEIRHKIRAWIREIHTPHCASFMDSLGVVNDGVLAHGEGSI